MGNSEVGHLNLGAGRPVLQDLPRIDAAIADGSFFTRPALLAACERARETGRLHAVGLDRPGRRPRPRPPPRRARRARRAAGRAVRPRPCAARRPRHAAELRARVHAGPRGAARRRPSRTRASRPSAAATGRWTATSAGTASSAATTRSCTAWGTHAPSATAAIEAGYARGETDEFLAPTVIDGVDGALRDRDPIVHFNFRADRARQLTHALARPDVRRASTRHRPTAGPRRWASSS